MRSGKESRGYIIGVKKNRILNIIATISFKSLRYGVIKEIAIEHDIVNNTRGIIAMGSIKIVLLKEAEVDKDIKYMTTNEIKNKMKCLITSAIGNTVRGNRHLFKTSPLDIKE
jgi:hypothetical protein